MIGLELVGPHAVAQWRHWLGATDPARAAPGTLRQLYGYDILKNVAHGCHAREDAAKVSTFTCTYFYIRLNDSAAT